MKPTDKRRERVRRVTAKRPLGLRVNVELVPLVDPARRARALALLLKLLDSPSAPDECGQP